jgi:hypothetical protein
MLRVPTNKLEQRFCIGVIISILVVKEDGREN